MINSLLDKLKANKKLSITECIDFVELVFGGSVDSNTITDILLLINKNGFGSDELTGFATAMRNASQKVITPNDVVDNCGTGGDGLKTFNVSTTASLIASSCGVCVAKHGNKAVTSKSGSADLLEFAGVNLEITPEQVSACLSELSFGFMFAPLHHSSMRFVASSRKEISPQKTIFNLLGPLTNPAGAKRQLIGVYSKKFMRPMAETLINLGTSRAMIVHSFDGLDEISIFDKTYVLEVDDGNIKEYVIDPENYFSSKYKLSDIVVNDVGSSLSMTKEVFKEKNIPAKNIAIINAAAIIYISGTVSTLDEGIKISEESISSGKVTNKLDDLITFTNNFKNA